MTRSTDIAIACAGTGLLCGLIGWVIGVALLALAGFALAFVALVAIAVDDISPPPMCLSVAGAIFLTAIGVAVLGYFIDKVAVSFGGWCVAVVAGLTCLGHGVRSLQQ